MSREKILAAYEAMAENYNERIDHKPHNAYYDRPNTLSLLSDVAGKNILDAACGPGKYAELLTEKGGKVVGFDISPRMIDLANKRNQGNGDFFVQDLSEPFNTLRDQTFDTIVCALAMHYVEDWTLTLKEFNRVLKPNGELVMSIEHPFFEYQYFRTKKYFEVEPVSAVWRGFGKRIKMHSYRRPLQECINPLLENGFYLDQLLEPRPVEKFKELDPKHYKELNRFPAFMCIRAIKR